MDVMRLGPAGGDEIVAHEQGKREVGQPIAVQMAQLATAVPELRPAKPVAANGHAGPTGDVANDAVVNGLGHG